MLPNGLRYAPSGHRWAGVDNAWEQEKLEASLPWRARPGKNACLHLAAGTGENGDESHLPKRSEGVHALLARFLLESDNF
jgi:hypothetical protein